MTCRSASCANGCARERSIRASRHSALSRNFFQEKTLLRLRELALLQTADYVDSGHFKGREEIDALVAKTNADLERYIDVARRLGFPAEAVMDLGTEVVATATELCEEIAQRYPRATIISGKLVFRRESFFNRLLHNETPTLIQRRLQWVGVPMVVLPVRASV